MASSIKITIASSFKGNFKAGTMVSALRGQAAVMLQESASAMGRIYKKDVQTYLKDKVLKGTYHPEDEAQILRSVTSKVDPLKSAGAVLRVSVNHPLMFMREFGRTDDEDGGKTVLTATNRKIMFVDEFRAQKSVKLRTMQAEQEDARGQEQEGVFLRTVDLGKAKAPFMDAMFDEVSRDIVADWQVAQHA